MSDETHAELLKRKKRMLQVDVVKQFQPLLDAFERDTGIRISRVIYAPEYRDIQEMGVEIPVSVLSGVRIDLIL